MYSGTNVSVAVSVTVMVDVVERWQLQALLTRDDAYEHWERMAADGSGAKEETGSRFWKMTVVPEILKGFVSQSEDELHVVYPWSGECRHTWWWSQWSRSIRWQRWQGWYGLM